MIHLIATVAAKPGKRSELLAAVRANRVLVLEEPGCIEYTPLVDAAGTADALGPDTIVVVERWADAEALDAHRGAPHTLNYRKRTADIVQSRTLHLLSDI
jgi:quinol monooxygenase YgiN